MSLYQDNPALSQLTLGKSTPYRDQYDASLLQAVPRSMNREPLGLFPDNLPFHGADIWTLYELSWLNDKGLPQVAVGEISLNANSINLIESNCLITHQPDWGSVQIQYRGPKINREALLRYLVSFRNHNEFHEQCVERIFNDIMHFCAPETLAVYARYTRRGGLDINPWRSNFPFTPATARLVRQ